VPDDHGAFEEAVAAAMVVMGVRIDDVCPVAAAKRPLDLLLHRGHDPGRGLRIDDDQALLRLDRREIASPVDPRPVGYDHARREPFDADKLPGAELRARREQVHQQTEMDQRNHFCAPAAFSTVHHDDANYTWVRHYYYFVSLFFIYPIIYHYLLRTALPRTVFIKISGDELPITCSFKK